MKKVSILLLIALLAGLVTSCTIFVPVPTIVTFDAAPQTINAGDSTILVWAATNANSVVIAPGIGQVPSAGSRQISPTSTTTYTMTATGISGTVNRAVVITVNPRVAITNFVSSPSAISAGGTSTLQWNVTGATSVTIDQGIGSVPLSGSRVVSPSTTTTYNMIAIGGSQVVTSTAVVTVNSPPVVAQFTASPQQIPLAGSSQLNWDVRGAIRIRIDPGIGEVPAYGSRTVQPSSTTTYVLTAESDCCVINRTVTVTVAQLPVPSLLPVVQIFNISPNSIYKGNSATLSWQVSGANQVIINQGVGNVASAGTLSVTPLTSTIYTLTAYNQFGYRSVAVGIIVFGP
jgi:hypothetical protein